MIPAGFFQTVEFFVIAALAAAAVVAYMTIPKSKGEAVTHTVGGELLEGEADEAKAGENDCGELLVECRDDGSVVFTRTGIDGMTTSGAVSLAATVIGFDMHVEERRTRGFSNDPKAGSARFVLDFLAPEWYHVRYAYSDAGEFCSFQLHVKPGIKMRRRIRR